MNLYGMSWFELELWGLTDARELDRAVREGARLEEIHWVGKDRLRLRTDWQGIRIIRQVYRGQRVGMRVSRYGGWLAWWRFLRRRPLWIAGFGMFVAGLYVLSSLIWTVQVTGTDRVEPEEVLAKAREIGLVPGAWRPSRMEIDRLQGQLLELLPDAGWVGLHLSGTRVTIEVMERIKPKKDEVQPQGPQEVVAGKPGVVESVLARRGISLVQRGQAVAPGTVIISGQMPDGTFVAAEGKVNAHVWYTSDIVVPLQGRQLGLTGEKVSRTYITLGSWAIPVWGAAHIPFASYVERSVDESLKVAGRIWPLGLRRVDYLEAAGHRWTIAQQEAVERGLAAVRADLLARAKPGARVQEQKILHQEWKNGNLYMTVWTDVVEDIGVARPMAAPAPGSPEPISPN
ncbi:sporulation protein YqfD [Kyrpidia tusciae]|uniref:Stage IV sporulation YqfD n=1 Tax=Kyrpidia tusciae (strain DSM 2912 / NBRC 15312 / T2) TaxID=562970 RepID=D5WVB9_KYRT2|nr:sporulation protein YqfD [Kyrpidia tusciae]ADG05529.1 putative stage IV sporulation YqfD [Kyrpidia tusciae DSM 2912]